MTKLILMFCSICIITTFSLLPDHADAASKRSLSVRQIMKKSSPAKALSIHRRLLKKKTTPSQMKRLQQRLISVRYQLRRPVFGAIANQDREYANLIRPVNWCTDLVRKTCGSEKQCPNSTGCPIALQLLQLYNNESNQQDKMDLEYSCVASLEDNIIFPSCD